MTRIIIDAGHGGETDGGAVYQGRLEKDDNLALALAVGERLKEKGFDVVYTRDSDIYQTPVEKARLANEYGGDWLISFHRNSSPNPNTYSGAEVLVYQLGDKKERLALSILEELEKTGYKNLGVSERPGLAILRRSNMPSILIETGFINTDQDNTRFDAQFDEIADAIVAGIEKGVLEQEQMFDRNGDDMQTVTAQSLPLYPIAHDVSRGTAGSAMKELPNGNSTPIAHDVSRGTAGSAMKELPNGNSTSIAHDASRGTAEPEMLHWIGGGVRRNGGLHGHSPISADVRREIHNEHAKQGVEVNQEVPAPMQEEPWSGQKEDDWRSSSMEGTKKKPVYKIQLGLYYGYQNALNKQYELINAGYPADLVVVKVDQAVLRPSSWAKEENQRLYSVQLGGFPDYEAARKAQKALESRGFTDSVILVM